MRLLRVLGKRVRMDYHNHIHMHISMLLMSLLTVCCLLLTTLPHSQCQPTAFDYSICKKQSYNCGNLSNISYPFWGQNRSPQCGSGDPFELSCNGDDNTTSIRIGSLNYTVKEINITAQTMRLVPTNIVVNVCFPQYEETYESRILFRYSPSVYNVTIFYNCSRIQYFPYGYFRCGNAISYFARAYDRLFTDYPQLQKCKRSLNVSAVAQLDFKGGGDFALKKSLNEGFEVNYNVSQHCQRCLGSEGHCWRYGIEKHVLSCYYCPNGTHALHCSPRPPKTMASTNSNKWKKSRRRLVIGVTGVAIAGLLICITILCLYKLPTWKGHFGLNTNSNKNIEALLKVHGAITLKRYKLSNVKKMTNNFKVKLGQGGFGSVYKGKLPNGAPVAVKILNASKKDGEEFMNEVASISRTSHINVVTLLGFSLEGRKRVLIYEFMPNGSLDKLIYRKGPETIAPLSWDIIYEIAIGIARGLEYLHIGCNTRILHFDIKPHNILLDEKFCPKISDFGLAKLCPRNESIISLSDARGTMGYVAPEVLNRHFAGVSLKSDVYSYGMMLLEMVGGRKNTNAEASNMSEIYFPHWIFKRLQLGSDLRLEEEIAPEENEIAKRLAIVGLWCIQTFPNDRPTMSRVIDMLEVNINSLEIPPKPLLSSPTTSLPESSIS
ncbi:hypothetical protein AAZX31_07G090800 [Glycine max]|nr:hypothetical protein GYH30_017885 [Glycine max]